MSATFPLWILLTTWLFFRGFLVTQKAEPPVLVALCCGAEGVFLNRSLPKSSLSTLSPYMAGLDHHAPLGPQKLILVQNVWLGPREISPFPLRLVFKRQRLASELGAQGFPAPSFALPCPSSGCKAGCAPGRAPGSWTHAASLSPPPSMARGAHAGR